MNDNEIVKDFLKESKALIEIMNEQLEQVEEDISNFKVLSDFGNNVDRIMGGAQSLAMMLPQNVALQRISDFAAICKAVGYKAANSKGKDALISTAVALLLDAVEALELLLNNINSSAAEVKACVPVEFLERLKWVSDQFGNQVAASVGAGGKSVLENDEIADLLKKLGL